MRYCKKCTMPDTRPGITFDEQGVCSACRHFESRKNVDWDARFAEFEKFCDKYRGMNGPGGYDCAVAVSGGEDSHFQVWVLTAVTLGGRLFGVWGMLAFIPVFGVLYAFLREKTHERLKRKNSS